VPGDGGFGLVANVFAQRVQEATFFRAPQGVILGHVIAHELGHLLLGEARHSAGDGIMHIPWKAKELQRVEQGVMFFLPQQAEKLRAKVFARTSAGGDSPRRTSGSRSISSKMADLLEYVKTGQ
jgi:hypothetical protein